MKKVNAVNNMLRDEHNFWSTSLFNTELKALKIFKPSVKKRLNLLNLSSSKTRLFVLDCSFCPCFYAYLYLKATCSSKQTSQQKVLTATDAGNVVWILLMSRFLLVYQARKVYPTVTHRCLKSKVVFLTQWSVGSRGKGRGWAEGRNRWQHGRGHGGHPGAGGGRGRRVDVYIATRALEGTWGGGCSGRPGVGSFGCRRFQQRGSTCDGYPTLRQLNVSVSSCHELHLTKHHISLLNI